MQLFAVCVSIGSDKEIVVRPLDMLLIIARKTGTAVINTGHALQWAWYHLFSAFLILVGCGLASLPGTFEALNNPLGFIVLAVGAVIGLFGFVLWDDSSQAYAEMRARGSETNVAETEYEEEYVAS